LYLPEEIFVKKGGIIDETTDRKIVFDRYDSIGNLIEYHHENSEPIAVIWGYNNQYPIAKIENSNSADIGSFVSNLQTLSDADTDEISETQLRAALASLQNETILENAQMTYYTYDPLIGVTSITDPKGETTYYHYDEFNRLQVVKDAEGNVLSKNEYHYKN